MENNLGLNGFFRHNRKLENCLLAIGLVLFIALGMRGLDKINDRAVASGESNRNVAIASDSPWGNQFSSSQLTGLLSPANQSSFDITNSEKTADNRAKNTKGKLADAKPHSLENTLDNNSARSDR